MEAAWRLGSLCDMDKMENNGKPENLANPAPSAIGKSGNPD